ncbi:hypothetical protein TYRP_011511 [Tyrophagus putrescentiae]|nr:hypothetical protein TYRP_011511 [Tyrophagus putrescentiae]
MLEEDSEGEGETLVSGYMTRGDVEDMASAILGEEEVVVVVVLLLTRQLIGVNIEKDALENVAELIYPTENVHDAVHSLHRLANVSTTSMMGNPSRSGITVNEKQTMIISVKKPLTGANLPGVFPGSSSSSSSSSEAVAVAGKSIDTVAIFSRMISSNCSSTFVSGNDLERFLECK